MKDQLALAACAMLVAASCWAFWHFLEGDAINALLILALAGVSADNFRLRRKYGRRE